MAALPKAVQAQLEEAERLQAQLVNPPANPDPNPQEDPPAEPQEPVAQPVEQPAPPVQPAPEHDATYWKRRFETIEGKYRAEVPALHDQLRQLSDQLRQLQGRFETQPQAPAAAPQSKLVTERDDEKFGSDLVDLMRRVVRDEVSELSNRLNSLETLAKSVAAKAQRVERVEQEVAVTREESFWRELQKEVPDWEKVNADPNWLAWLSEYDPVAGKVRQQALVDAQRALDYQRVAALFKQFKGPQPAPTAKPNAELARQVAPARSSKTTAQPTARRTYTGQDYSYWLDPRRVNDTAKAELEKMLAEMESAFVENRIQW